MIWQLMKRDPASCNTLIGTAAVAAMSLALPHGAIGMCTWFIAMPWLQSQPSQRATEFQATLPIRVRDLFLSRIVSLFAAVWLPALVGALTMLARGAAEQAGLMAAMATAFSVATLGAQSSRVRETTGSQWAPAIWTAVVCSVGMAAWSTKLHVPWAWGFALCCILCAGMLWNIWRQLPATFEVVRFEVAPAPPPETVAATTFVWKPILRGLFPLRLLGFVPMIVIFSIGGQWPYLVMFCAFPVMGATSCLSWALTLPVRRGALVTVSLLPWGVALLLGVLLGNWFGSTPSLRLVLSASHQVTELKTPLEFWHIGKAPVIEAPWGERWQPETVSVRGVAVYNPYSFGPANSARFFEWQFRRATQAVYGEAISYADFMRQGPTVRPLMRQARLLVLNLCASACLLMLLANAIFTGMHWRFQRVFARMPWAPAALVLAPLAGAYLIDIAGLRSFGILMSLVNALLLRLSAVLPAALPAVALAGAIPVVLLGWTAARLLRGVELPKPAVPTR